LLLGNRKPAVAELERGTMSKRLPCRERAAMPKERETFGWALKKKRGIVQKIP